MLAPQHNYTNLSSAVGLGLIGFNENDIAIDYGYRTNDRNVILEKTIQMARECNSNIERVFCGWDEGTLLKSL